MAQLGHAILHALLERRQIVIAPRQSEAAQNGLALGGCDKRTLSGPIRPGNDKHGRHTEGPSLTLSLTSTMRTAMGDGAIRVSAAQRPVVEAARHDDPLF